MLLSKNPTLKALEVDQTHRTSASASNDEWIGLWVFFISPANSALNVVRTFINVLCTFDLHSLFQLLVVKLLLGHLLLVATEVLNSESDSSEFDCVELLNFVVVFAVFIFKGSGY